MFEELGYQSRPAEADESEEAITGEGGTNRQQGKHHPDGPEPRRRAPPQLGYHHHSDQDQQQGGPNAVEGDRSHDRAYHIQIRRRQEPLAEKQNGYALEDSNEVAGRFKAGIDVEPRSPHAVAVVHPHEPPDHHDTDVR